MTFTPISSGTPNWDVPLNAAMSDLQTQIGTKFAASGGTVTGDVTVASGNLVVHSGGTAINAVDRNAVTNFAAYVLRTGGADRWSLQMVNNSTNDVQLTDSANGTVGLLAESRATMANLSLLSSTKSYGGGVGVAFVANCNTAPTTNPAGGSIVYSEGGVLKMRTAAGAVVDLSGLLALAGGTMTGAITSSGSVVGSVAAAAQVTGDAFDRWRVYADGKQEWGPGSGARDTTLSRGAANRLDLATADLRIATAGRGLQVAEGSNAKSGTAVLVAGAVTVANTSVTANSRIQLTTQVPGGAVGSPYVSARVAGTSFTITSTSGTDTSTVAYLIVEP